MSMKKAALIVIDSFGIGALPDAEIFGDAGSNTALHICQQIPGTLWPNLKQLGLGNASLLSEGNLPGCESVETPLASFGIMNEKSPGKDTTTGHWEMSGIVLEKAFPVFPPAFPSFPEELIKRFLNDTGCGGILGNKASSGTAIIEELGAEHQRTGWPICYTSADSVFQIAAHNDTIPLKELYRFCEIARNICDDYQIGRVIARPFIGDEGSYSRTADRHDYSIALPEDSILDHLQKNKIRTQAVGKIGSIFNESGITDSYHDSGNPACMNRTSELLDTKTEKDRFIFINLVDTDMVYGHRRDVKGYGDAVGIIDERLPGFMEKLNDGDVLIITGDHGCDPSFRGTDHTREYVPLLWYQKGTKANELGIRESFSDLSQTLCTYFNVPPMRNGKNFLN